MTVTDSAFINDAALGGEGTASGNTAGNGGNAYGGAIFNAPGALWERSTIPLPATTPPAAPATAPRARRARQAPGSAARSITPARPISST